jgi:Rieske Fe-S protein
MIDRKSSLVFSSLSGPEREDAKNAAMSHQNLSRRDFIKATTAFVGSLIGITIGLPTIAYLVSPSFHGEDEAAILDLGPLDTYPIDLPTRFEIMRTQVNGWERTATDYGLYVVRQDERNVRVFSDICTHLGCRVTWHADQNHYISPCHNGHFDRLGNVVSGPPPRPLDEFITRIEKGNLLVVFPPLKRTS